MIKANVFELIWAKSKVGVALNNSQVAQVAKIAQVAQMRNLR